MSRYIVHIRRYLDGEYPSLALPRYLELAFGIFDFCGHQRGINNHELPTPASQQPNDTRETNKDHLDANPLHSYTRNSIKWKCRETSVDGVFGAVQLAIEP